MLTAGELADARAEQLLTLTQTAWIRRTTQVSDGAGGSTETSEFIGPLPCRVGVSKLQRGELLIAGQLAGGLPWPITFEALTDIRLADDINVGGAVVDSAFVGGRNFEVLAPYAPTSFETARQVVCAEK